MKPQTSQTPKCRERTFENRTTHPQYVCANKNITHRALNQSAASYQRSRDLTRLIALMPQEIDDHSTNGNAEIIAKIKNALRSERRRGQAGHWSYNLNRHAALLEALKAETVAQDKKV